MIQLLGTDGCAGGGGSASGAGIGTLSYDSENPSHQAVATGSVIGLSIAGLDLTVDIYDFVTAAKQSDVAGMALSGFGMIPVVGAFKNLKYLDEIAEIADTSTTFIKSTDKAADVADIASTITKNVGNVVDTSKDLERTGEAAGDGAKRESRFIVDEKGNAVDLEATPRGSNEQPNGGRTDILQKEDHGAGLSHTHNPVINTNPVTGVSFPKGLNKPGEIVTFEDVMNIVNNIANSAIPKGR